MNDMIMQATPHDSPENSSFLMSKISAKFERGHPNWGARWSRLKSVKF